MSSKFNRELKTLIKDKVISPELAEKIEQYYATKNLDRPNKLFLIFGIFGALLVGTGIILMLAHNWDNFPKLTKTILVFVPLLLGQILVGFVILKKKSKTWKEASGTFLFFSVGASISLVSQIYNIPGELGSFLRTWTILCLPLIYLLRSNAVALLTVLTSTYYAVEVGVWQYRSTTIPWLYLVFFLAVLPYYWGLIKKNISGNTVTIFNWVLPVSITIALSAFISNNSDIGFVMYVTLFGLLYNIGKLSLFKELKILRNGALVVGSLGTVISLLILTFRWVWDDLAITFIYDLWELWFALALLIITVSVFGYTISKKGLRSINIFQGSFIVFWIVYFLFSKVTIFPIVMMNLLVFSLGISAIKIGADRFDFKMLNYGLLIISILIICRFFDTGMSFVIRGALFVLVGVGFFLTNYIMLKKQQKIKGN